MSGGLAATPWPESIGPGYWQRLRDLVRSEFRVDIYRPAHDDPILRRERACGVPGCRTTLGPDDRYCRRHDTQWREAGAPSHDDFLRVVPPTEPARISGGRVCAVEVCANPVWAHGWCRAHDNMWKRRGCPEGFAETAPKVRQSRLCRVPNCGRPEAVIAYGLCGSHRRHWAEAGEPPLEEFLGRAKRVRNIEVVFSVVGLPPGPKLELQYVLQQRRDALEARVRPVTWVTVVEAIRAEGRSCRSLLDQPLEHWEAIIGPVKMGTPSHSGPRGDLGFLRWAYAELALLVDDDPFTPDVWQARRVKPGEVSDVRTIDWSRIPQPWLREAAKRWGRVRATTLSLGTVHNDARRLARFGQFLASSTHVRWPRDLNRQAIEAYLARLCVDHPATERDCSIGTLRRFLDDAADHGLLDLRREARVRRTDYPRRIEALPRFLPEPVMAVLEAPANLALLEDNGLRNAVKVLMGTGRRAQEVLNLGTHCVQEGPDGDPYLRFYSGKMAKEDMIPIDPATARAIADQQALVLRRWPGGSSGCSRGRRSTPSASIPSP